MTHELKDIVASYLLALKNNKKCVLATLVDLDGSSYRRPGVRMLITEDGQMTGAISGGCIEKDVLTEAVSVFNTGIAKMMAYDGRYRMGCEGTIYILVEVFNPSPQLLTAFNDCIETRKAISINCYYTRELISEKSLGTAVNLSGQDFVLNQNIKVDSVQEKGKNIFSQKLPPMFQLVIFGGEHDAAKLCLQASLLGWQVVLVTNPFDGYTTANFPKSSKVLQASANQLSKDLIDENSAVVIMSHNYAKDLSYLMAIRNSRPVYLGLLGPVKRRNKLLDEMMEHVGDFPDALMQLIHGPAGLNIGAETAEEIALSICSEIITVKQKKDAGHLKRIKGGIHCNV